MDPKCLYLEFCFAEKLKTSWEKVPFLVAYKWWFSYRAKDHRFTIYLNPASSALARDEELAVRHANESSSSA